MKKLFAFRYVSLHLFATVFCTAMIFSALPYQNDTAHSVYVSIAVASGLLLACLWGGGTIVRSKGLKKGRRADDFSSVVAKKIVLYYWLMIVLFIVVLPFYVMLVVSLEDSKSASIISFRWWPGKLHFENFITVLTDNALRITVWEALFNTLWVSTWPSLVCVFISSLSAYSFSKLKFKGKNALFAVLIMTMMVPGCVTLSASYMWFDRLGWLHTFMPLIVPSLFGGASVVFFLREYYSGIPDDLLGSAKIDGLGKFGIFFGIILPLSVPAFVAQLVLTFVSRFNDYMGPLIYCDHSYLYTLAKMLNILRSGNEDITYIAGTCVVSILPLLILYACLQKVILSGISMSSGLKA